jgi:hypothetical protein
VQATPVVEASAEGRGSEGGKSGKEKKGEEKKGTEKKARVEEIDKLIDAATSKPLPIQKTSGGEKEEASSGKKPGLTRDQVAAGMKLAHGAVLICNEKYDQKGMVTLQVTIDGTTGRIREGRVQGDLSGSPVGTCVLEAARRDARFPKFSGQPLTFQYAFILR